MVGCSWVTYTLIESLYGHIIKLSEVESLVHSVGTFEALMLGFLYVPGKVNAGIATVKGNGATARGNGAKPNEAKPVEAAAVK